MSLLQRFKSPILQQVCYYRAHVLNLQDSLSRGRSIAVPTKRESGGGELAAYARLRNVLNESKVRDIVRAQSRHERKHDEKRRKKKEKLFNEYLQFMKKKIEMAYELKRKYVFITFCFLGADYVGMKAI